jgi:hypothetical protein
MNRLQHKIRRYSQLFLIGLSVGVLTVTANAAAFTQNDQSSIINDTPFYDSSSSDTCGETNTIGTNVPVDTSANSDSDAIAKTIIGIAKTENLGTLGATIALMTAIDESTLQNLANSKIPVSLSIPHDGVGDNENSVGVFQQEPNENWSTLASGTAALSNSAAVAQLMDPAYAAEAFFGAPSGSNAPAPLTQHGLQTVSNWQNLQPWQAAQETQGSGAGYASSGAATYGKHLGQAQSLIAIDYASAPAVALPVPFTGSAAPDTSTSSSTSNNCTGSATASGDITVSCTANGSTDTSLSSVRQNVVCLTMQELQKWTSGQLVIGTGYKQYSQGRDELWCADFVSWIYNQAGDPLKSSGWNVPGVDEVQSIGQQDGSFHYHAAGSYTPVPGDIVVHTDGESHVNIVVAVSGSTMTLVGGDQHGTGGPDGNVVNEYTDSSFSGVDGVTGFVSPD